MQLSSLFFQPRLNQTTVFVPNNWLIGVTHTVNACRSLGSGQNFSYHTYQVVRWSVCFFILYFGPLNSGINRNASFNMRAYSICLLLGRNVRLCDRHVGQTLKCYSCLLSCVFVFICSEPQACGSQGVWNFHEGVWCKNACLCLLTVNGSLKWNLFGCFRWVYVHLTALYILILTLQWNSRDWWLCGETLRHDSNTTAGTCMLR